MDIGCFCCGDTRLLYENGPDDSVCEDCATAGCSTNGCRVELKFPPRHYRSGPLAGGRCSNDDCPCGEGAS